MNKRMPIGYDGIIAVDDIHFIIFQAFYCCLLVQFDKFIFNSWPKSAEAIIYIFNRYLTV